MLRVSIVLLMKASDFECKYLLPESNNKDKIGSTL